MNDLPTFKSNRSLPPPDEAETMTETSSQATDDGAHLDGLRIPDLDDGGADPDAPFAVGEDGEPLDDGPPEQITREAFWVVFQTAFNLPGQILPPFKPVGIQPGEEPAARAASDAVYALLEIYYPSALMPQSETLAHLLVAGPFFLGKVMVVREIIRASKARPVNKGEPTPSAQSSDGPASNGADGNWHLPGQEAA